MTAPESFDKPLGRQFAWFVAVGVVGFLVDMGFYLLLAGSVGLSPPLARLAAFVPATLVTWALNRTLSFGGPGIRRSRALMQYIRYLQVQGGGIALSFAIFYFVQSEFPGWQLVGLALGSLAAMVFNFAGSRLFVFLRRH